VDTDSFNRLFINQSQRRRAGQRKTQRWLGCRSVIAPPT
ncbi:MAG: hypothetical protein ACI8WB_003574, partial [Phenylobacterium sp.]